MTAVNLDQVYDAIAALHSPDPVQNGRASRWLEEFQKSIYAWTTADQILGEARSFDACLFAAQTIRNKVLHSIRELPPESYSDLRSSLLSQLSTIEAKLGRNASSIVTLLCAALSDLYIQVVEWHGFISQMLAQVSSSTSQTQRSPLLCLFKTLPEELYNRRLKVGENRRAEVELELATHTQQVLANLSQLCTQNESSGGRDEMLTKAVDCLASWLLNKKCSTETLAASPLLQSVLGCLALQNTPPGLHDAATECTVNALQLIDDEPKPTQFQLANLLQQGIFGTLDAYRIAMREEDSEKLQNYARIYAEHCECFLTELVKHPREGFGDLRTLEMLQLVNDYHEYGLIEMSFNVWYRLSEYLYQCEEGDFDELREVFCPFVEKHILALCKHCRAEPDSHDILDGRSELADFRSKAQESIKDVTFIVGSVELLRRLMELLNSSDSWDQMEAILFIISAFVPNVVETERQVVPTLLEAILKLPMVDTHKQLLKTSAQLLGNLQDWLQANSDYMVRAFNWFCSLFEVSGGQLALTVAECLEQLIERGWQEIQRRSLHQQYQGIIEGLTNRVEQSQSRAQEMEEAAQHLLKASAHLINDLPTAQLCVALEHICAKPIARLNEINKMAILPLNSQPTTSSSSSTMAAGSVDDKENFTDSWSMMADDPVIWLDRLSAIWRIIRPWQQQLACKQLANENQELVSNCPWLPLCSNVIECAMATLQQYQAKQRVVEHSCRTIRFLIRSMGAQSIVFIEPVASQIMLIYAQHPHSCLIYLASILVDEYGTIQHVQQGMQAMLENLATQSLALLAADAQNGFRDNPDTVDDLYRLAIRFVQRCPMAIFLHPIANQLLQAAIHGISLNHSDANRSISKFIQEIIDVARGKRGSAVSQAAVQQVSQLLAENGSALMFSAISAALFHLSNTLCKEMADIVFLIIQMDKQKSEQWLNHTCLQLPHDGGNSATPEQLMEFRTKLLSAERPYDILTAMRELNKFYA